MILITNIFSNKIHKDVTVYGNLLQYHHKNHQNRENELLNDINQDYYKTTRLIYLKEVEVF